MREQKLKGEGKRGENKVWERREYKKRSSNAQAPERVRYNGKIEETTVWLREKRAYESREGKREENKV